MRVVRMVLALAVSLVLVGTLQAADKKAECKDKHAGKQISVIDGHMLKGLALTDDQKTKIEAIKTEYAPKVKEAQGKIEAIPTAEQKKARDEAAKAAKAAGKKRGEVWKEAQDAMKLTDAQKASLDTAKKAVRELRKEVRGKVVAVLTPEQQEQMKQMKKSHSPKDKPAKKAAQDQKQS